MRRVGLTAFCTLACGAVTAFTGCSDSTSGASGANEQEPLGFSQSAMTGETWSKLDAPLRLHAFAEPHSRAMRSMFVQSSDPEGTRRMIEAAGGRVGTIAGDVMTVRVPSDAIAHIASAPVVAWLEDARPLRRKLDKALTVTNVDKVHAGEAPLSSSFKGAGVVVGVIDAGLDAQHAAFNGPNDKTRVRAVWDQTGNGTPPAGFSYGTECAESEIAAGTCGQAGSDHGTHVTGISAGARVEGMPYVGVAPEADIVFVNVTEKGAPGASEEEALGTALCDGASYIFKKAAALKKPAVINMSLGEHLGPHDGSSLAERCLDNLTGPGKIIVASAGNEGGGSTNPGRDVPVVVHATGTASKQPMVVKWLPNKDAKEQVSIWTDADVELSVRVGFEPAAGGDATYTRPITLARPLSATMLSHGAVTVGSVAGSGSTSPGGPKAIQIKLSDTNKDGQEAQQTWLLEITGNGRFDAFIDTTQSGGFLTTGQEAGVTTDSSMTIGFPASASKVLAVASFVSRDTWKAADGSEQKGKSLLNEQPIVVGAISDFSSRGPLRNPSAPMKPDIAAPGELLAAALNAKVPPGDANELVKASPNGFKMMRGTSMASPMVAGIVALMLERNPAISVDNVRSILGRTAVKPDGVTTLPDARWGRGKIDAAAALVDDEGQKGRENDSSKGSKDSGGCQASPMHESGPILGIAALVVGMALVVRRRRERHG